MGISGYTIIDLVIIVPAIVLLCGLGRPIALILTGGELSEFSIGSGDVLFGFGKIKIRKSLLSGTRCLMDFYDVDRKFANIFFFLCGPLIMLIISGTIFLIIRTGIIYYTFPWKSIIEISILAALINLIPYTYNGRNSDGKQILHILKYGCSSYSAKYNKHMKEFRIILEAEKLKRKGEYDKALDKLYKIIQYNPDFIDVKFIIANIYKDKKEYENAVKIFESLLEIMPDDKLTLTNAGVMYSRMGNMDKYYELTKRAYDIDDRDVVALNNMADYYCRTNNFEQARVFIEKAIMIDKYEGVLYSTACEIALRHGETEEFYKNFELALKYSHDMSYIYQDPVFVDIIKEKCLRVILEKYGMSSKN